MKSRKTVVSTEKLTKLSRKVWRENRFFIVFLVLMFCFRSSFADWNQIPSGSMKPTIIVGDRIWVNKLAYDLHLPFSAHSLYKIDDPKRGDIIIFNSEVAGKRLVKRVVAVPGDRIAMQDNRLILNGQPVNYRYLHSLQSGERILGQEFEEDLAGVKYRVRLAATKHAAQSFAERRIPEGYYMAMGDNRDNSADSRIIGLVPRSEIIGKSESVVISLNYDRYFLPRSDRVFKRL